MPVDLGNCEISYQVKICGDLEDECITEPVYENFIEIPESLHCTEIIVGVGIEHQGQIGPLSFKTYDGMLLKE